MSASLPAIFDFYIRYSNEKEYMFCYKMVGGVFTTDLV